METWQKIIIFSYLFLAIIGLAVSLKKCLKEKNNLGLTGIFVIYGAFVWADLVIFSAYWILFSSFTILRNDWILFLLGQSVFWFVRSLGESQYWFNQQFSDIHRTTYRNFFFSWLFNNDNYTVWFVMQILMQCITVVSAILSIYLGKLWINNLF